MRKLFSIFAALTLSVGLWAANSVITFTSTGKLYPGDLNELMDNSKWEAFKAQYPELAGVMNPEMLMMMGVDFFNPNCFLDANGQVLPIVEGGVTYDESTQIGTITFAGELVTIKDGVSVYDAAFYGCSSLTSITLPEGLTSIEKYSFYESENLTTVNLPASLTTIGNQAFLNCYGLTSVNFAAGSQLTTIGGWAFSGCQSLATITIPASVTEIKDYAIEVCVTLTDVYVSWTTTLPTLGEAVFSNTPVNTATLHVPAGSLTLYQDADQWKDFDNIVEYDPLADIKAAAIAAVNAEIAETDNDNVKAIATDAATAINAATTVAEINALKTLAIANIASAKAAYGEGYDEGYDAGEAAVRAELPTEGYDGPAVIITKGEKVLTLFNPEKVEYKILEAD